MHDSRFCEKVLGNLGVEDTLSPPLKNCPAGQRSLGYVVPLGQLFLGLSRSALGFAVPLRFCKQSLTKIAHSIGY